MAAVTLDDIHRLTLDEYLQLADSPSWERTELIGGVVYDMSPLNELHTRAVARVCRELERLFPDRVRPGGSVQLGDHSMVEPDVYVVEDPAQLDPDGVVPESQLELVVEISVTSHGRDLGPKLSAYATADVPEYWVIDPREDHGYLLRHTCPVGDVYTIVRRIPVGYGAEGLDAAGILAGD